VTLQLNTEMLNALHEISHGYLHPFARDALTVPDHMTSAALYSSRIACVQPIMRQSRAKECVVLLGQRSHRVPQRGTTSQPRASALKAHAALGKRPQIGGALKGLHTRDVFVLLFQSDGACGAAYPGRRTASRFLPWADLYGAFGARRCRSPPPQ
jgi:hypothetical protein